MASADEPRLPPLPPDEWPAEMRGALAALHPPAPRHPFPSRDESRPKGLNALGVLAHHPALTTAFNTFNGHVLFATTLTARQRELLVLRVAARRDAAYEWAQHVVLAADAGISEAEVERIARGADPDGENTDGPNTDGPDPDWSALDQALLNAADELVGEARISDATWRVLAAELDEQQLMDVVFTVGAYDLVAMAFRTFDVELDADLEQHQTRKRPSP